MTKESAIKRISEAFEVLEMRYTFDAKENVFLSGISMENVLGNISLLIIVEDTSYCVYATLGAKITSEHRDALYEYLHRANYGLKNGNFEMDPTDGEVRYKIYISFAGMTLSKRVVVDSIGTPFVMFDQYGKDIMKLAMGIGKPEDLIKETEKGLHG